MKLVIIARTAVCANVVEYLNSYGGAISYRFTQPDFYDGREISVFLVEAEEDDIQTLQAMLGMSYDTSSVLTMLFVNDTKFLLEGDNDGLGDV